MQASGAFPRIDSYIDKFARQLQSGLLIDTI